MDFVIVGAGGVGGNLGARLVEAGHRVAWVVRGANLQALRHGLTLKSPLGDLALGPQRASDAPRDFAAPDAVVVTVKLYDLASIAAALKPLAGPRTLFLPLQNGVEAHAILGASLPPASVLKGMVSIKAHLESPGAVVCKSGFCRIRLGGIGAEPLVNALKQAKGVEATLSGQIDVDLWKKFVMLTSFSSVSCLARASIGQVLDSPESYRLLIEAATEAAAVARARGIPLPADVQELVMSQVRDLPRDGRPSMLEDLEAGRPLELEFLSGAVARLGAQSGVATPFHSMACQALAMHSRGQR
jgi:2-dehydropantoate 2-reductase